MAKGAQDYYQIIDITAQSIASLATRPTYGGVGTTYANFSVTNGQNKEMISITGQGIIYGGYILLYASAEVVNFRCFPTIDGHSAVYQSVETIKTMNLIRPHGLTPTLIFQDEVNFDYALIIEGGVTFESTYKYNLYNLDAAAVNSWVYLYYALT